MRKEKKPCEQEQNVPMHDIPALKIYDLEGGSNMPDSDSEKSDLTEALPDSEIDSPDSAEPPPDGESSTKKRVYFNSHIALLAVFLIFIGIIVFKFMTWGEYVDQEEIFQDGPGKYEEETFDYMAPLTNAEHKIIPIDYSDGLNIVVFGNSPFSDDRGSKDSLSNIIAEMTGGTVYNCSISGSYLASEQPHPYVEKPMDAFTFYWLAFLTTDVKLNDYYGDAVKALGENAPPEIREVRQLLKDIDFDTVDVIAVMYDATDYLMGHPIYNSEVPTDIQTFTGNLTAGIEVLQREHPDIRIIVMSPTCALSEPQKEYDRSLDSDIYERGDLYNFVTTQSLFCSERSVTFIDHYYGTVTDVNAEDYLTDGLHLNVEGRRKVAERFVYALNYYNVN